MTSNHDPRRMSCVEGAIYALEGLTNAPEIVFKTWKALVEERGAHFVAFPHHTILGRPNRSGAEKIAHFFDLNVDLAEFAGQFEARFNEGVCQELTLRPGASRLLYLLKKPGIQRGLITSMSPTCLNLALDRFGLHEYFRSIVTSETKLPKDVEPEMAPYVQCADQLGLRLKPAGIALFEYCPVGVRAGLCAGMFVVALANACVPIGTLHTADIVLASIEEIEAFALPSLFR